LMKDISLFDNVVKKKKWMAQKMLVIFIIQYRKN
jgi:hypothetical protein